MVIFRYRHYPPPFNHLNINMLYKYLQTSSILNRAPLLIQNGYNILHSSAKSCTFAMCFS